MENDTETGGEELTLDEAVTAYAAVRNAPEPKGQTEAPAEDGEEHADDTELEANAEGEGEEGEAETDGQATDETDNEPETEKGRFVAHNGRVKLPDGTESTVADLIQGNLRDRDYRQKTMGLSDERKSFEAKSTAVKERETKLDQREAYVAQLLKSVIPGEPDPSLLQSDPLRYMTEKANYEAWGKHLAFLDQQQQSTAKERAEQAAKDEQDKINSEWGSLVEKLPQLKDAKKVDPFIAQIRKAGEFLGFKPDELKAVALDHRFALALDIVSKWQTLQTSKANVAKKVENRPPVIKGGKRLNPNEARARNVTDLIAKAKQTGRLDDVAAAYHASRKTG